MLETVFAEKDEHRASRRQFTEDSIAKAYGKNAGAPAASCTGGVPIVLSTVFSVDRPRFSPCWRQPIGAAALFHFCGAWPRRGPCPA